MTGLRWFWPLLCCLWWGIPTTVQAAGEQDKAVTEAQIKQLKQDIKRLQNWLQDAQSERDTLLEQLRRSETDMGKLQKLIREQEQQLKQLDQQIKALEGKQRQLEQSKLQQKDTLARQLRAAYINGQGHDRLKMLLSQQDPSEIARLWQYQNYLHDAHLSQLQRYRQLQSELELVEAELQQGRHQRQQQLQELQQRQQQLAQTRESRNQTLAALQKRMGKEQQRLAGLKADEQRLQTVLSEIQKALAAAKLAEQQGNFPQYKGRLPLPLNGRILASYGSQQDSVRNDGLIIAGQAGDLVKAVHGGRVVFADWLRGFGLLLILDHGQGYMTLYGHNETLLKDTGDWVQAGEALATLGRSGGQSTSSLYFAIRYHGKPTDPRPWLKQG